MSPQHKKKMTSSTNAMHDAETSKATNYKVKHAMPCSSPYFIPTDQKYQRLWHGYNTFKINNGPICMWNT